MCRGLGWGAVRWAYLLGKNCSVMAQHARHQGYCKGGWSGVRSPGVRLVSEGAQRVGPQCVAPGTARAEPCGTRSGRLAKVAGGRCGGGRALEYESVRLVEWMVRAWGNGRCKGPLACLCRSSIMSVAGGTVGGVGFAGMGVGRATTGMGLVVLAVGYG